MNKLLQVLIVSSFATCLSVQAQIVAGDPAAVDPKGPQFRYIAGSNVHDYGHVTKNTQATYQFEFKNSGGSPLVIYEAHSGAMGRPVHVSIACPKKTVKPNRSGHLLVTIDAGEETGSFKGDIYVSSNATGPGYPLLHISGAVVVARLPADTKADINPSHNGGTVSPQSAAFEIVGNALMYLSEKK